MGFLELLTVVFIVLKIIGVVTWSWFWVIAPMYPAILLYLIIIVLFTFTSVSTFKNIGGKKKW